MPKSPAKAPKPAPKRGPKTPKQPEVRYVYRRDAFNKVKLA